jgi:hypothetical protein
MTANQSSGDAEGGAGCGRLAPTRLGLRKGAYDPDSPHGSIMLIAALLRVARADEHAQHTGTESATDVIILLNSKPIRSTPRLKCDRDATRFQEPKLSQKSAGCPG